MYIYNLNTCFFAYCLGQGLFYLCKILPYSYVDYMYNLITGFSSYFPVQELLNFFKSMRTRFGKLNKKFGQGGICTERDQFILDHFSFLKDHIRSRIDRQVSITEVSL